jgi:hypothetical protein
MCIILKFNIIKSTSYKNRVIEQNEKTKLWDAFVTYLETIYFPGASEILDAKLVAFEYESYMNIYN